MIIEFILFDYESIEIFLKIVFYILLFGEFFHLIYPCSYLLCYLLAEVFFVLELYVCSRSLCLVDENRYVLHKNGELILGYIAML